MAAINYLKIIKSVALFAIVYGLNNNNDPFSQYPSTHHSSDPPDHFHDHESTEQFDNLHLPQNTKSDINDHDYSSLNPEYFLHPDHNRRVVRNANDNLKQFLDRTSIIARIANGIALQTGLINGSIPIDDAIGELLNFGSAKVSDFVNFQPDKINALLDKMKIFQNSLTVDWRISEHGEHVIKWEAIRRKSEFIESEIHSFAYNSRQFKKRIDEFLVAHDETSSIRYYSNIDLIPYQLKKIVDIKDDPGKSDKEKKEDYGQFTFLFYLFNTSMQNFDKMKENKAKFDSFNDLKNGITMMKPVQKLIDLIEIRSQLGRRISNRTSINTAFIHIPSLTNMSKVIHKDYILMRDLIQSRVYPRKVKRLYTNGFPNGGADVRLLSDGMQNAWVKKILASNGNVDKLVNALTPIIKATANIDVVDSKLKSISTTDILHSITRFASSLDHVKDFPSNFDRFIDVIDKTAHCERKGENVYPKFHAPDKSFRIMNELWSEYAKLRDILNLETHPLVDEMESFKKFLNFEEIGNAEKSMKQIPDILKKLKTSENLQKLIDAVEEKKEPSGLYFYDLRKKAEEVKNDNETELFLKSNFVSKEFEVHECIRNLGAELNGSSNFFEFVVNQDETVRDMKPQIAKMMNDMDTIISTLSQASKNFVNIKTKMEELKKVVNSETEELNKMADLLKVSQIIGQSVSSLWNAYELKELESSIPQLQTINGAVIEEIKRFVPGFLQARLDDQWGDHEKDVNDLMDGLKQINAFDTKLNVSSNAKTISECSALFKDLVALTDVKIEAAAKSRTLRALLNEEWSPINKAYVAGFEAGKQTLDKIAVLDLQFSSYKSQFQQAPVAFQTLQDFLTQFLMKKDVEVSDEVAFDEISDNKEDSDSTLLISLLSVFGGLALVALIVALIGKKRGWFKRKAPIEPPTPPEPLPPIYVTIDGKTKVPVHLIIVWLGNQVFKTNLDAFNCHESIIRMMMVEDAKRINTFMYPLSIRKHRVPTIYCNPATALTNLAKMRIYIHANRIITKNGKIFIATQTPMLKTSEHDDTTEEFWMMAMLEESDRIVMISSQSTDSERMTYLYATCGDDKICGRFTVRTRDFCDFLPGKYSGSVFKRVVEVTDTKKQFTTRQYTHFQFPIWDDQSIPLNGHEPAFSVLREVLQSDKPIIVHCQTGTGRTMSFIGIEYIAREIEYDTNMTFSTAMAKLNEQRWFGFQTTRQSLWVHSGVVGRIAENIDIKYSPYPEMLETLNEVAYEQKGIPAVDNRNVKF